MNIKMSLLVEALSAVLDGTLVTFLATLLTVGIFLERSLRELEFTLLISSTLGDGLSIRRSVRNTYHRSTLIDR